MLEGDLTDFALPDILRLLAYTTKTGRLHVHSDGTVARIDLVDGRVRDASADATRLSLARRLLGAGLLDADGLRDALEQADYQQLPTDLQLARQLVSVGHIEAAALAELVREQTIDALFDLLRWDDGRFRFERDTSASGDGAAVLDLAIKVEDLLSDAEGRLEAWQDVAEATGAGSGIVSIVRPDLDDDEVGLPADAWSLLTLVDGARSVDELVALTGRGQFRTRSLLRTLVERGVVRVAEPGSRGPVDDLLAAHASLASLEHRLGGAPPPTPPRGGARPPAEFGPDERAAHEPTVDSRPRTWGDDARARSPEPLAAEVHHHEPQQPAARAAATPREESRAATTPREESRAARSRATKARSSEAAQPEVRAAEQPAAPTPPAEPLLAQTIAHPAHADRRVHTDPRVDAALVTRLIKGVEAL